MTDKCGYAYEHGDAATVQLAVMNTEWTYRAVMKIIGTAWWDDDDQTWNDLDKAARQYRELGESLPRAGDFIDLAGLDYDAVDWAELVRDELAEVNIQEGRDSLAGLE